jgi:hypothetical protein
MLTPENCIALARLHANPEKLSTSQLLASFSEIVKPSTLSEQKNHNFAEMLKDQTRFEQSEKEIIDTLYRDDPQWPKSKSWMFEQAKKKGASRTIVEAITDLGALNAETEYCFLVREFCRVNGDIGLQYFLSKCTPLPTCLCSRKAICVSLLLEAINMALEVLDKVETRCSRSSWSCLCAKFNGCDKKRTRDDDDETE